MFQFIPVAELTYRAPEYIVSELIEADTLGLIFGDPGCGKSFLTVDIALSVATGTPFHERATKQGAVFSSPVKAIADWLGALRHGVKTGMYRWQECPCLNQHGPRNSLMETAQKPWPMQ